MKKYNVWFGKGVFVEKLVEMYKKNSIIFYQENWIIFSYGISNENWNRILKCW